MDELKHLAKVRTADSNPSSAPKKTQLESYFFRGGTHHESPGSLLFAARGSSPITMLHMRHFVAAAMPDAGESYGPLRRSWGNGEATLRLHSTGGRGAQSDLGPRALSGRGTRQAGRDAQPSWHRRTSRLYCNARFRVHDDTEPRQSKRCEEVSSGQWDNATSCRNDDVPARCLDNHSDPGGPLASGRARCRDVPRL
jgi:hypothetical protein